jgi:hypothetical protein
MCASFSISYIWVGPVPNRFLKPTRIRMDALRGTTPVGLEKRWTASLFECYMEAENVICADQLSFPVSFGDIPLIEFKAAEQDLVERFGVPHQHSSGDEISGEPGPCVYWAFGFSCGLKIVITHYLGAEWVKVCADSPEVEHIIRHLKLPTPNLWRVDHAEPVNVQSWLDYFREQGWDFNARWELWRQDDNGQTHRVAQLTSKRDAHCLADEFERMGHKQMYWVEKAD